MPARIEVEFDEVDRARVIMRQRLGAELNDVETAVVDDIRATRLEEGKEELPTLDELILPLDDDGRAAVLETVRVHSPDARTTESGQLTRRQAKAARGERQVVGENVAGRRRVVYDFTHPTMAGARDLGDEILAHNRVDGDKYGDGGNAWLDLYMIAKGQESVSGGHWAAPASEVANLTESQARLMIDIHHFEREIGAARAADAVSPATRPQDGTEDTTTPLQRMENMARGVA